MSEEAAIRGLVEVVLPVIADLRRAGYFNAAERALMPGQTLTLAWWKPLRRTLWKKNNRFWPLIIEDMRHIRAQKYFIAHGANKLVDNMTKGDLKSLKRFVSNNWGMSQRDCIKALEKDFMCSPARARRIIHTERHTAQGGSDLEYELERGVVEYKTWDSAKDGVVRDL